MNSLSLKQLRYLEMVARHGHFGRAAAACAISQPALSMQIRDLEAALGVALVERTTRQVRLTGVGERVVARARDILLAVEELGEFARTAQSRVARLRFGIIPTIAPYFLPGFIRELTQWHPGIDLIIREKNTSVLVEELVEGSLDAAIVALPIAKPALVETALFDEAFVLVRPGEDAGKPMPNAETLSAMRLLLLEEGHCFRDQALAFCSTRSIQPREIMDGSTLSTLVQMVGAGIGVTLIPEMALAVETRSAPVAIARFDDPQPCRTIGMIWRRTTPLGGMLADIAALLRRPAPAVAS
jgi:LysR family hydrogen peroxide-inducible transcriptional activator